jgi:1-acyl-sn-glycerol-3-phosphate acyltransferase
VIPARKQRLFNSWFAGHARTRLERAFERVRVHGLARAQALSASAPLLVVSNHTSWWDPLLVLHTSQHLLGADGHALMDAANLRRLPFFAMVGAFGVDLGDPGDGARAIRYAARLLDEARRLVWIFPQGRERPVTERPLAFQGGSAEIARVARRAVTLPAAIRYELGATEKPVAYLSFGDPLPPERDLARARAAQERAVEAEMDRIELAVRGAGEPPFDDVLGAPAGPIDDVASRALARLTRGAIAVPAAPRAGPGTRR